MHKSTIVKLFLGSLMGIGAALVMLVVSAGLAMGNGVFVMNGPDVVGVNSGPLAATVLIVAAVALLALIAGGIVQFVAWIGAVLNTAQLADKTWFVVLLVLGLLSLALPVMIAYVAAGPDGTAPPAPVTSHDAHHPVHPAGV